jgi:RES domain
MIRMNQNLNSFQPLRLLRPSDLYRLALSRTPWEAHKATSFEQRFDDSERNYLVLYASSSRLGCFVECLAHFRSDPDKLGFAELKDKFGNSFPEGSVPPIWCRDRFVQIAQVAGSFADIAGSEWLARLLKNFPENLRQGLIYPWLDQSTIYQDKSRAITQWISRFVFDSAENLAGIYYTSKLGSNFSNWAVFEERAKISNLGPPQAVTESDADLLSACRLLGLNQPTRAVTQPATVLSSVG